jgi:triacylglycerol lipase
MRRRQGIAGALALALGVLGAQGAQALCIFNCSEAKTKYPIVLAHGLFGFDELFGVVEYWYGIPADLRERGAKVYVTTVTQANTSEFRGEELLAQVEEVVAISGKPKVNLIGHSQGGLDVRYVAAVRPDLVASVTAVAGPHKGAELATFLKANFSNGGFLQPVIGALGNFLADLIALFSGADATEQDIFVALDALSADGTAVFNSVYGAAVPATACGEGAAVVNGVRYYSWSGTGLLTNALDIGDPALAVTSLFYDESNDGLVGRCSSHLGDVIRDNYFQNHLDEVNQVLGLVSIFESNPKTLFRSQANRLKNAGL